MKYLFLALFSISAVASEAQEFIKNSVWVDTAFALQGIETSRENGLTKWVQVDSVFLYGGGSLLGQITAPDEAEAGADPTGSIGLNFVTQRLSVNLFYSYNGKQTVEMRNLEVA